MKIPAKKSLGQNFLINEGVAEKITAAADLRPDDTVVEIGPGTGNLTRHLSGKVRRLILIEKDRRLIKPLMEKFGSGAEVIEGDVLEINPADLNLQISGYKIVANLPYYITSHFFRTIFETWPAPQLIVAMVQKEVAQRIVAQPPKSNLLGLSVQFYAQPEIIADVSAGSFRPVPSVDSAIIRLIPHERVALSHEQKQVFFTILKAAFAGKRKKLSNTLKPFAQKGNASIEDALASAGVDPAARPQHLGLADWLKIASNIKCRF